MKNLIDIAIKAAITAGIEIMRIYNDPDFDLNIEKKADNTPLTLADKVSNKVIEDLLNDTGIPILSEEGKNIEYSKRKDWQRFWLVDPLDGTKEFIKRNGEFTVNIALMENNKPVTGIIYVPVTGNLYVGKQNEGAWKLENGKEDASFNDIISLGIRLPIETKINKRDYVVIGSRSHLNAETKEYISHIKEKYNDVTLIARGSSLKICMVAEGIADEYPRFGPTMEWDTAAGNAIVNAVGKKLWLTDLSGELSYNKKDLHNPDFIAK